MDAHALIPMSNRMESSTKSSPWKPSWTVPQGAMHALPGLPPPPGQPHVVAFPMVTPKRLTQLSANTARLLAAFGLGGGVQRSLVVTSLPPGLELTPPVVVLLTGPSGSGKSQTIRPILDALGCDQAPDPPRIDQDRPIIEWIGDTPEDAARRLAMVGLTDAYTWCRLPSELSVGQRARLEVAAALREQPPVLVCDEWLAHLDRITARAVAWATGRALRKTGQQAIIVTSHTDLATDLQPDVHLKIGWSPEPAVEYHTAGARSCTLIDELRYRRGDARDWKALKHLHYAAGDPATVHSYHVLAHPMIDHPACVALMSYPDLHSAARNLATDDAYRIMGDRRTAQRLNREVLKLSRIVVAPELRGCGVASLMIENLAARLNIRYIECVTAMGRWTSFLTRCGFREVPQSSAPAEAALLDFARRHRVPDHVVLDPPLFAQWAGQQSVRVARECRRLVWRYYHHFVLHRRTRSAPPKRIPGPDDPGWNEAWEVVCRRIHDRPAYYILGPIDQMTGLPEDPPHADAGAATNTPENSAQVV